MQIGSSARDTNIRVLTGPDGWNLINQWSAEVFNLWLLVRALIGLKLEQWSVVRERLILKRRKSMFCGCEVVFWHSLMFVTRRLNWILSSFDFKLFDFDITKSQCEVWRSMADEINACINLTKIVAAKKSTEKQRRLLGWR